MLYLYLALIVVTISNLRSALKFRTYICDLCLYQVVTAVIKLKNVAAITALPYGGI